MTCCVIDELIFISCSGPAGRGLIQMQVIIKRRDTKRDAASSSARLALFLFYCTLSAVTYSLSALCHFIIIL